MIGSEKKGTDGKDEILVPLTSSLYVKGRLTDRGKVLVDVGTGFYVEKVGFLVFSLLFWFRGYPCGGVEEKGMLLELKLTGFGRLLRRRSSFTKRRLKGWMLVCRIWKRLYRGRARV